jgi:hypothetical protein
MSAHLYCWETSLRLNPGDADFQARIKALHRATHPLPPSPVMLKFVEALLSRFPDLTETDDTIWADGPLDGNILGSFINISIIWSRYDDVRAWLIQTAHAHRLHCYDPQESKFFPLRR